MTERFRRLARAISDACATWQAFALNALAILIWAALGPVFAFSAGWQLIINTGTTIITYLLVFLVMNTQARDSAEIRLKLDELILASGSARNSVVRLDDMPEAEVHALQQEAIARAAGAAAAS